ncbi:MAG: DUF2203 domain-containing protein [Planctomycetota bacterium]
MPEHSAPVDADPRPIGGKVFSLEEANRALPYLSRVVLDITEVYGQILELRAELENLDDGELRNLTEREYETTMDRLGVLVDELHLAGAELRDFERGRIDLPARHAGRPIMFTWTQGEPAIAHWHPADPRDFTPRPVEDLRPAEAA